MHPDALPATPDKDQGVAEAVETAAEVAAAEAVQEAEAGVALPESPLV